MKKITIINFKNENQLNQEEQLKEKDITQHVQDYLKVFEDILTQINEEIYNLDS
ncbi:MAG: hypothetical protein ACR5KW_03055 [Wolbachia sp.]